MTWRPRPAGRRGPIGALVAIAPKLSMTASLAALATLALLAMTAPGQAQDLGLDLGGDATTTARVIQLVLLLTVLSLAPSIIIMVTSFTRIVVVLSFLRSALGTQQTPPNTVLVSLALFLTAFVMAPTFESAYDAGIQPLLDQQIDEFEAFNRAMVPVRAFMMKNVREQDLLLFLDLSGSKDVRAPDQVPLRAVIPAFMISELKRAFEIGFLIFIPFVIIDMVIASLLMSMGMMMLPPVLISLPFKLVFFVLVDGWYLIAGSLVQSFG